MSENREPSMNLFDREDCERTLHELYHFLDGELTDDVRREIQHHLDHCSPCVEAVSFEAELRSVVADRCRETVPAELLVKIAQLIDHELETRGSDA